MTMKKKTGCYTISLEEITLCNIGKEKIIIKNPCTFITKQLVIDLKSVSKQDNFFQPALLTGRLKFPVTKEGLIISFILKCNLRQIFNESEI